MPKYNVILNLPGFTIQKVSGYQPILFDLSYTRLPRCAHCNSKAVRKKDSYMRMVHHELIGHRRVLLRFKAYKLYCNDCHRYGNQQFAGINKHQRSTERLQSQIYHQHTWGASTTIKYVGAKNKRTLLAQLPTPMHQAHSLSSMLAANTKLTSSSVSMQASTTYLIKSTLIGPTSPHQV